MIKQWLSVQKYWIWIEDKVHRTLDLIHVLLSMNRIPPVYKDIYSDVQGKDSF
jgi:hypothetical protein